MDGLVGLLPLVGILLIFWLLVIRPASRRQKDQLRLQSSVAVGDEVVLTSGFFGTVRALHDDRLEVELAPGTVVTVARGAVGSVVASAADRVDRADGAHGLDADDHRPAAPRLEKTTDAEPSNAPDSEES